MMRTSGSSQTPEAGAALTELVARYAESSGRDLAELDFYIALGYWKLAIILEGLYMHYLEKTASNPASAEFEWYVPVLVDRMHRM